MTDLQFFQAEDIRGKIAKLKRLMNNPTLAKVSESTKGKGDDFSLTEVFKADTIKKWAEDEINKLVEEYKKI